MSVQSEVQRKLRVKTHLCYDIAVPVVPRGRQMIEPCDWVFTSQRRHREQGGNGVGSEEKQGSEGPVGGARTEAIKAGNELAIKLRNRHRFCAARIDWNEA